jgi:O-antigen/teichoic acid export membrane protein
MVKSPVGYLAAAQRTSGLRWAGRSLWAIIDQGLFSVSNFVVGVLLARWLSPEQYGAFTLAYSLFLLFGMVHTALLTEPMLVFGSSKHADNFFGYLRVLKRGHWSLTTVGTLLFAVSSLGLWLFGSADLAKSFFGIALASPFILLTWLARRACFACLRPKWAAIGGAVHFTLMLLGTILLSVLGALSPLSALLMLGVCSFIAASWLLRRLSSSANHGDRNGSEEAILRDHWNYGRWAVSSSVLSWAAGNVHMLILPLNGGLGAAAAVKALLNIVLPMLQANVALAALLLPALARLRGQSRFPIVVIGAIAAFGGGPILYWIFLGLFAEKLIHFLYGGQYVEYAHLLWFVGILPVIAGIAAVLSNTLRALERPDQVFWAYFGSAIVAVSLGPLAILHWGIRGAIFGQISSMLAMTCILFVLLLHGKRSLPRNWGVEQTGAHRPQDTAGATNTM